MIQILTANHAEEIMDCFDSAIHEIKIVSPYLSPNTADILCRAAEQGISCTFVTRVYVDDFLKHSSNIDSLRKMLEAGIRVYAMIGLHAKLYLFDDNRAILGSANFTESGLHLNYELSIEALDEPDLVSQLHDVYDSLVNQITDSDKLATNTQSKGIITAAVLDMVQSDYNKAYSAAKGLCQTTNIKRYGADIRAFKGSETMDDILNDIRSEQTSSAKGRDIVNQTFASSEPQKRMQFDHAIWLKQEGTVKDRGDGSERKTMAMVHLNGKTLYIANASRGFSSFRDGDEIYIANQSTDKNGNHQRMIVGRGLLRGYSKENAVPPEWLKQYPWMEHFKYYCVIDYHEILNTEARNGIPLDLITQKLGSDAFVSSYGKDESIKQLDKKMNQRSYIQITPEAKNEIDRLFESLKQEYGVIEYQSE